MDIPKSIWGFVGVIATVVVAIVVYNVIKNKLPPQLRG